MREDLGIIPDDDRALLRHAAEWPDHPCLTDLKRPVLAQVAAERGADFATALLYDRLRRSEPHGPFIRRVDELLSQPPVEPGPINAMVAVAPGLFYRELPRSGADGWLLRQRVAAHGCRTAVLPTHSQGTVAENGKRICAWLSKHPHEMILLASLSKGAADIKAALAQPEANEAFRPVAAWLNLSGMPDGTPLVNWLFQRKLMTLVCQAMYWWKGLDFAVNRQLAWGPDAVLDFALELPAHVRMINVVGFPLRRHFTSSRLRRCHRRIAPLGPNDGFVLLADACALPGLVYPVWGADHNLRPAWDIRRLVAALAYYLAETLNLWASPTTDASPQAASGS
ncbi:hypothetical protein AYO44_16710 [Planctomycetaceae bacterium SCGC AG-212-F19]|nr:hypothetical protein AYO44_16710 [Planctomycetaceae bacterium SCGC AG-212-F19]